jgi:four helix bundle protein
MDLAVRIFHLTEKLPRKEDYGLTSQIRDSSLSVPGNIAETKSHLIYGQKVGYLNLILNLSLFALT